MNATRAGTDLRAIRSNLGASPLQLVQSDEVKERLRAYSPLTWSAQKAQRFRTNKSKALRQEVERNKKSHLGYTVVALSSSFSSLFIPVSYTRLGRGRHHNITAE
jgi:hypothetical protein